MRNATGTLSSPLSSNLRLWITGDGTNATEAYDVSGKNNNAVLKGNVTRVPGIIGDALDFNGNGTKAIVSDSSSLDFGNTMSVAFWIKDNGTVHQYTGIISKEATSSGFTIQRQKTNENIYLRVDTSAGANQTHGTTIDNVLDGRWHHIVFTLNNGNESMYKDGQLVATSTYAVGNGFAAPNHILQLGGGGYLNAYLDDVRVYDSVLSASQVQTLYKHEDIPATLVYVDNITNAATTAGTPPAIGRGFDVFMHAGTSTTLALLPATTTLAAAKAWGANLIRVVMEPRFVETKTGENFATVWPKMLDNLYNTVLAAKKDGLKVVVDMHEPPIESSSFGTYPQYHAYLQSPEFWARSDLTSSFTSAWTDIAKKLLPLKDTVVGYDLYNEPADTSQLPNPPWQWRFLADHIISAIRAVDPTTWIVYEPGPWGTFDGFPTLVPLEDKHVIYSAHLYSPSQFTNQGIKSIYPLGVNYPSTIDGTYWDKNQIASYINSAVQFQQKWNVPIYVGEFSVVRWAPHPDALTWLSDVISLFEAHHWSWTYWAFRSTNGNVWDLEYGDTFTSNPQDSSPVSYETDRAKLIKQALAKNNPAASQPTSKTQSRGVRLSVRRT